MFESSSPEKDLRLLVCVRLDMSWQCVFAAQKFGDASKAARAAGDGKGGREFYLSALLR